jgi:hypothetical protein
MSYDKPFKTETYGFPSQAFGATTASLKILGPKGKKGLVREIRVYPTADFVGTTTVPEITVGSAASDAGALFTEYARFRLGTTAIAGYTAAGGPYRASALAAVAQGNTGGIPPVLNDYPGHVALQTAYIPADTPAYITGVKGAGGTPAGTARFDVDIDWD